MTSRRDLIKKLVGGVAAAPLAGSGAAAAGIVGMGKTAAVAGGPFASAGVAAAGAGYSMEFMDWLIQGCRPYGFGDEVSPRWVDEINSVVWCLPNDEVVAVGKSTTYYTVSRHEDVIPWAVKNAPTSKIAAGIVDFVKRGLLKNFVNHADREVASLILGEDYVRGVLKLENLVDTIRRRYTLPGEIVYRIPSGSRFEVLAEPHNFLDLRWDSYEIRDKIIGDRLAKMRKRRELFREFKSNHGALYELLTRLFQRKKASVDAHRILKKRIRAYAKMEAKLIAQELNEAAMTGAEIGVYVSSETAHIRKRLHLLATLRSRTPRGMKAALKKLGYDTKRFRGKKGDALVVKFVDEVACKELAEHIADDPPREYEPALFVKHLGLIVSRASSNTEIMDVTPCNVYKKSTPLEAMNEATKMSQMLQRMLGEGLLPVVRSSEREVVRGSFDKLSSDQTIEDCLTNWMRKTQS